MIHSFLLIGQSNMAGRGIPGSVPPIINESIKTLCNGRWQMMSEPLHHDRPTAGVGLASSFAACWQADHPHDEIGLIPCADGGTSLDDWQPGGALFDHAVLQARLAQRNSELTGILWHQGENDSSPAAAGVYRERFEKIIQELRNQLNEPDIPLIVGALGDFLPNGPYGAYFAGYNLVNEALHAYAQAQKNCFFVSAEGLTANEDQLHFDAASLRKFGLRYYQAFKDRTDITSPLADEEHLLESIYNRPLSSKERVSVIENLFAFGRISFTEFQQQVKTLTGQ
ncbi:MAG: sialate O-acetylesterase [Mucilaginibacter polytrichastri]|nr:sialate O-acetylesterase [Mucilaginibacter polytrichastri]